MAARVAWDVFLVYAVAAVAGVAAGLSLAAGGLSLAGVTLFDLSAESATVMLVAGPLLGFLPLSLTISSAARRPHLAGHLTRALGLWFLLTALATAWFGVRPLLA
ncbi:MAG: hypothetical protein M3442_12150 [Chloroflexota bacterium]|nr:hypothetical protein [Chloroflexota bacterium]